jgi:hypothetical protein
MKAQRYLEKPETIYVMKKCLFPKERNAYLLTSPPKYLYSFSNHVLKDNILAYKALEL